jgi:hypothetical protein
MVTNFCCAVAGIDVSATSAAARPRFFIVQNFIFVSLHFDD